jgi:hypothetical protein
MSLFISEAGARRAAQAILKDFKAATVGIRYVRRTVNGWQTQEGYRVTLFNAAGHPVHTL